MKSSFLETGKVISLACQALVDKGKDQADQKHIDRHRRTISKLEAHKPEAVHVRGHCFTCIDRSTLGHDPYQNELLYRAENRDVDRCANGAGKQGQGNIKEVLERVGTINARRLLRFPGEYFAVPS